ncbi:MULTISPECIES: M23 family metallopeptidase [unclassified Plantactinospora]|uniref:M23 family metallopeptidase n=1 Tax=unclassified Plantactinospora TaxID=2631981 RepID=UPI000D17498B|nr:MULTISPECIES: M23 family metallopeptidase [unclassified Plantactinospora]AVT35009.1 peptidase M23 [Plantactinospora sp. BC1]AVT41765.1 peptidase M23 [Plantactinospora sp. BB1]
MRQRLSSEPDRYRGRRRVPTPPRSRYAAVVTTAFVGAGVVALGAGALPDAKAVSPSALADLEKAAATSEDLSARAADAERPSRDDRGDDGLASTLAAAPDVWRLPLDKYSFTSPYGMKWNKLHAGIDLAAPEGTPYHAVHAGTVTKAGWFGGYGYCVIVEHADGTESIYGHSSKLLVTEGQEVKAGDQLGLVGNTGHSYGSHLHLELHVKGKPTDPIPYLRDRDVDIQLQVDDPYAGVAAS